MMSESISETRADVPPEKVSRKETRTQTQRSSIDIALYAAQHSLHAVAKDRRNEFSKYNYVSVDGMVSACRDALHENGLMVSRSSFSIDLATNTLVNRFVLVEPETGASRSYETPWLFFEEKGKPIDKALAGALSSSLNYFLRDLLLVVREEEGNMDRRNDKDYVPPRREDKKKHDQRTYESMADDAAPRTRLMALSLSKGDKWRNAVMARCSAELNVKVDSWEQITDDQVDRILKKFAEGNEQ